MSRGTQLALATILCGSMLCAQKSNPNVFLMDRSTLFAARESHAKPNGEFKSAIEGLLNDARAALKSKPLSVVEKKETPPSGDKHDYLSIAPYWWPDTSKPGGVPYIRRDGETNPEHNSFGDRTRLGKMIEHVGTLAMAYFISGKEDFARSAIGQLQVWYVDSATRMNPNLNFAQAVRGYNQGRGIGIIETYGLRDIIDAIGLLQGSRYWTKSLDAGLKEWFSAYLMWLQESPNGKEEAGQKNNHGSAYDVQVALFALYTGKADLARSVLLSAQTKRIAEQIEPNGSQPLELARTKSWGYSLMNTGILLNLALLGERVDVDLWNSVDGEGRGIRKAIDFLLPYALNEKEWKWRQIAPMERDRLYPILRLAAVKYHDPKYLAASNKLVSQKLHASRFNLYLPQYTGSGMLSSLVTHALEFAGQQLKRSVVEIQDSTKFARCTVENGSWKTTGARDWTSGFFPGTLWYMDEYTKDPFFRHAAERWTAGIIDQQFDVGTHDVGFKVFISFGNGNRLHPSESYKKIILQTAQTLAKRFNPIIGCIKSWDNRKWDYPVIIDNMMNLELLFWAAENGGPVSLREIAIRHAETTMKNHFRPDGTTYHVIGYDTTSGAVKERNTHQGYADESVWARGQAWAIYGYTMAYRFTRDERFLKTARRAADYFISHLPSDHIPYWDFMAPEIPNEPRDVSAAAIASSALFELSNYVKEKPEEAIYRDAATEILSSLCSAPYLAEGTNSHAILHHAVGSKPAKSEVDVSIIYADYYFIEAMLRYLKSQQ
jgi:unsaturated chondroitin disaccharide hydrolase